MRKFEVLCTVAAAALCAWGASAAHAQDVVQSANDADADQAVAASELQDIVVTATRRDERLQNVPISVTAISGEALARTGITNTRELTQSVPSLNFRVVGAQAQPIIRGVGSRGTSPGDETNVAIYIDGVYQPAPVGGLFDLLNVERVEVLRGPQGTLFGRNATGGLINVITTRPSHDVHMRGVMRYGRFNERSAQIYLTGGLTDTIAFDLSGQYSTDDGYYTDLLTNRSVYPREVIATRGRLLFEPSDRTSITFTASLNKTIDGTAAYLGVLDGNTRARRLSNDPFVIVPSAPYTTASSFPQRTAVQTIAFDNEIKVDLGGVTLQNTASYQRARYDALYDADGTPFDLGVIKNYGLQAEGDGRRYSMWYAQNELRLLSNGNGPLSYILGAYFITGNGENGPVFQALTPDTPLSAATLVDSYTDVRSFAGFGEATWAFAEGWKAIVGLRYTTEHRTFVGQTTIAGNVFSSTGGELVADFDKLTYRAILQRDLGDLGNVYASYSRGFKSGVFNIYTTSANSKPTRPEVLDAFELGLKTDPAPWLRINLAGYYYKYKDIQLSSRDPATGLAVLFNAANADIKGGEIEFSARPIPDLNLRAYATYTDSKYTNFPGAQIFTPIYEDQTAIGGSARTPIGNASSIADMSGRQLIRAPKYTVGGSVDYTIRSQAGDFTATANVFHSEKFYWDVNNRTFQPAYTVVNGEFAWQPKGSALRLSIWGKNLTDEVVQQQVNPSAIFDQVSYERPRSYGVSASVSL